MPDLTTSRKIGVQIVKASDLTTSRKIGRKFSWTSDATNIVQSGDRKKLIFEARYYDFLSVVRSGGVAKGSPMLRRSLLSGGRGDEKFGVRCYDRKVYLKALRYCNGKYKRFK